MDNYLDQYNLLLDMYYGCHTIIKDLDKFLESLKKIVDPNTVEANYMGADAIFQIYMDVYRTRSNLLKEVISYIDKYNDTLSTSYTTGEGVLTEIRNYLNVIDKLPKVEDTTPFKNILPQKMFDVQLVKTLRDPLMQSIRQLSQSNTPNTQSGVGTKPTNVVTSNAKAAALMDAVTSHINNPAFSSSTSRIRNTDVRAQEQATIVAKSQQAVQQKNVLSKLADGTYLADLTNTVETNTPSWIKSVVTAPDSISNFVTDTMGRYATRNLVLFDTLRVSGSTQQQDDLTSAFREQTRKKYGGSLGFCDETRDENGNWVLTKNLSSKMLLSDSRKNLRNKILGSITN